MKALAVAEPEGFSQFHLYVCASFLILWRKEILEERDFQLGERVVDLLISNLPQVSSVEITAAPSFHPLCPLFRK
ncbi:unnamed protein product [Arctogadus glacialis]